MNVPLNFKNISMETQNYFETIHISDETNLLQYISSHYRAISCSDPFHRSILRDLAEVIQLLLISSKNPPKTLFQIGFLVLSVSLIGINRNNIGKNLFYTADAISRTFVRHKWHRVKIGEINNDLIKQISHINNWIFYEINQQETKFVHLLQHNIEKIQINETIFSNDIVQPPPNSVSYILSKFTKIPQDQLLLQVNNIMNNHQN